MPDLDSPIHLKMHERGRRRRGLRARLARAWSALFGRELYGMEWGDPDEVPPLGYIRETFLRPYVTPEATVVEIGAGGGRWTREMLHARRIYAVDFHGELLDELRANFDRPNVTFVKNGGTDFPGVPAGEIDFVFSFGCFVHLEFPLIEAYLANMKPLLHATSNVVLHYADSTKPMARRNRGFSENDPERMRAAVRAQGYEVREEDTSTLWHSSVIRFGLPR